MPFCLRQTFLLQIHDRERPSLGTGPPPHVAKSDNLRASRSGPYRSRRAACQLFSGFDMKICLEVLRRNVTN